MENELIKHFGYKEIIDLISLTKDNLIISLPNIYFEISDSIIEYSRKIKKLKLIIDNSEDNFRNGYGDYKDVEKLRSNNIEIYEIKGNMVSFIISDETGYFLFPQSRIFSSELDLTSNAVLMDAVTLINIKSYFFPPENEKEKEDYTNEIIEVKKNIDNNIKHAIDIIESKTEIPFKPKKFDTNNFENVKKKLEVNPPEHPDLKRQINTYISKIQFVELSFIGINFNSKEIKIPSKILPYKDENIKKKLNTKMKLFGDIKEKVEYKGFSEYLQKYDKLREDYLFPIKCREQKNIIKMLRKNEFIDSLENLRKQLNDENTKLKAFMKEEILKSKSTIKKELRAFLKENPPEYLKTYDNNKNLFDESVNDKVDEMVNSIKFPEPDDITSKMVIKCRFYDLTIEDFKDNELLGELDERNIMEKNDIESIIEWKKAFESKK